MSSSIAITCISIPGSQMYHCVTSYHCTIQPSINPSIPGSQIYHCIIQPQMDPLYREPSLVNLMGIYPHVPMGVSPLRQSYDPLDPNPLNGEHPYHTMLDSVISMPSLLKRSCQCTLEILLSWLLRVYLDISWSLHTSLPNKLAPWADLYSNGNVKGRVNSVTLSGHLVNYSINVITCLLLS